jgi:hypothetical protein
MQPAARAATPGFKAISRASDAHGVSGGDSLLAAPHSRPPLREVERKHFRD